MTYRKRCEQWAKAGGHTFRSGFPRCGGKWRHGWATVYQKRGMWPVTTCGLDKEDACRRLWDLLVAMGLTGEGRIRDCSRVRHIGSSQTGVVVGSPRWTVAVSWDGSAETEEVPVHMLLLAEDERG